MDTLGSDFNYTGSVLTRSQLEEVRKKRGECLRCGRKCFHKKLFKLVPITEEGLVFEGRCLNCCPHPHHHGGGGGGLGSSSLELSGRPRRATAEDLERFTRSQSNLMMNSSSRNLLNNTNNGSVAAGSGGAATTASPNESPTITPTMLSGRRNHMTRAASSLPRSDHVSPSPHSRIRNNAPDFRRAASMSPYGSRNSSSLSPSPLNRRGMGMTSSFQSPGTNSSIGSRSGGRGGGNDDYADCTRTTRRAGVSSAMAMAAADASLSRSGHGSVGGLCSHQPSAAAAAAAANYAEIELPGNGGSPPRHLSRATIKRRSSHSDVMTNSSDGGSSSSSNIQSRSSAALRLSRSGDLPTAEELERAQMTILAAKESGMFDQIFEDSQENMQLMHDAEVADDPDNERDLQAALRASQRDLLREQEERDFQEALRASARDLLARSSHSQDQNNHDGQQVHDYQRPQRTLNRGGTFPVSPNPISPLNHSGSRRDLPGSMANIAEHCSLQEEDTASNDRSNAEGASNHNSAQSPQRSFGPGPTIEQQFLETLGRAGENYGEIMLTLREGLDSALVTSTGLEQLTHLQLSPEDQNILRELGLPLVIFDAMQAHQASFPVQLAACGVIWNTSGTTQNQLAFVECGIADAILTTMDIFDHNAELQEKAIAALSNLAAAPANLSTLDEKGAVSRIVKAMNKHSDISSLQVKGCGAVTNLAAHDVKMRERMVESGTGGAVVVSMVLHPNDTYVQEKALRALRSLCANSDSNKAELANVGGVDSVISAMQIHRDEAGVQQEAAWTLSTLAGNEVNKIVIGDCGGVDVVIRAMWVHSDTVSVQEWCCRALFTLTLDPQNCTIVLDIGGISAIVNAMQGHVDSQTVQEMGCAILGNLAADDQARMRIVNEEALDAIVLAMVLHTDDMQVQERACVVLNRLMAPSNYNAMKAANIPELVRTAARKFPDRCDATARQILRAF